jgi:NADH:ubiquinone oxidoreductase subunit 6 (subunit J)
MLIPLESSSNKIMYNSLRMFRFFSKDNLEQIINSYDEKIESLCQMLDIDKEMNENERKHDSKKSKQKIILGGTIAVIIIYIIITAIPVINTKKNVSDILSLIQESSDRLTLIGGINLFTYEVVNNDRSIFLDNEPKRILKDYISQLRKKQDSIKYGSYGGPSFDAYPSLDYLLKDNGCHRLENIGSSCDSVIYDSSYGFSEELATLPINELIYEYLLNVEQFINDVDNDKYAIVPFTNRENIKMIYDQIVDSDFFKLQSGLIDNIVGDIQFIDSELIKLTRGMVDEFYDTMIIIVGVGIVLIFFIVIFILNKLFVKKIKEMNTFISFLFLVPPSIVNKNEKYKRFLETTQTDD